jgi:cytochrome c551/c552
MKKTLLLAFALALVSCGDGTKKEESKGFEMSRTNSQTVTKETVSVPVDLKNKGIGPISSYSFSNEINTELSAQGKSVYDSKCTACHMANQRMIGPALSGVYDRRSPEWVLNLLLNTNEMLKEDPISIALLKEYNNAIMNNQNLSEQEAKAVAEYLRTL